MPSAPELRDAERMIRPVEVAHQAKSHDPGRADCYVRITAEIAVNLKGEANRRRDEQRPVKIRRMSVDRVHKKSQPIRHHSFFEQAPGHEPQAAGYTFVIEAMHLAKLHEQILRPFDGASNELRKEHDVESVNAEVALRRLPTTVHLYRVAHGLEGMKRKSDRQDERQSPQGVIPAGETRNRCQAITQEIEVFKNHQHPCICHNAQREIPFAPQTGCPLNQQPREVVDHDGKRQDQNVLRDEVHVEPATCGQ